MLRKIFSLSALAALLAAATPAMAEDVLNSGDTSWMIVATVLVIMMTIPGLALFYGGLVRTKNMLSVLMQVFATFALMSILWALFGYSLAFTEGPFNSIYGGFSKSFLSGHHARHTCSREAPSLNMCSSPSSSLSPALHRR